MARFKPQLPSREFYGGWIFVGILGVTITVLVFISRGGVQTVQAGLEDPGGCRVQVTANGVNVRADPSTTAAVVGVLNQGDLTPATTTVQNGYRELSQGRWAYNAYLAPINGSNCG